MATKIVSKYDSVKKNIPREKLYIHFDKSTYLTLDTIWFKGYLVNPTYNVASQVSGLVYVEMIDEAGAVIETLSLPTTFGLTWGAFALKDELYPAGTYTFRAYTNWMKNFGNTHIFSKKIKVLKVENPQQTVSLPSKNLIQNNVSENTVVVSSREIDFQFLPEGGKWLADFPQKLAFKAVDKSGKGIKISGEVFDAAKNKVVTFNSNNLGMGYLVLNPKSNETYTAKIKFDNKEFNTNLPKALSKATTVKIEQGFQSDSLQISIISSLTDQPLIAVGQARGTACFVAQIPANASFKNFKVGKNNFPTGVAQIILLDVKGQVLNERSFFVNHNDQLKVNVSTFSPSFAVRDSVLLRVNAIDMENKPVVGSFSVAVTDDGQVTKDSLNEANILSYLLLSSDLKGEIENPGFYFNKRELETPNELDILMLTQGWVSYDWNLEKKPLHKAEKEYAVRGQVTNLTNKPIANAKITLLAKNKTMLIVDTLTNANGEFVFKDFPLIDSATFLMQALNNKGKMGTLGITVEEFSRPAFIPQKQKIIVKDEPIDSISKAMITNKMKVEQALVSSGIALREVKIVGKRVIKNSKNLNGPGEASQILTEENLAQVYKKTLYQVLYEKVKGFREGNRRKSFVRDFFVNGDPVKFVFDGVELDFFYSPMGGNPNDEYYQYVKSYIAYYNAEDVTGIEIMANGYSFSYKNRFIDNPMDPTMYVFIEVTTKTGVGPFLKKAANKYLLKPVNYGSNKVFYSPKYNAAHKTDKLPDFRSTVYWNPNILTNEKGEGEFSFFATDKKGNYTVWLEGMDLNGNLGFATIKVKIE